VAVLTVQRGAFLAVMAGSLIAAPAMAAAADSLEYAVKAAYLVKFIPFIDWPDAVFASASQPVTICILGEDPFAGRLEAQTGQKSGDRTVAVKHVASYDRADGCQVLFVGSSAVAGDALAAAAGAPVVTVTDSGVTPPGIISFVIAENHVRFDIDDAAAAADSIKISSKLLELAQVVRRRSPP
jgi:hypothetical protein